MNNYIKPVIKLATTDVNGNIVSCGTTENDMNLILSIIGPSAKPEDCFGMNENCAVPLPIDMYCKFTSTSTGALLVFWS